MQLIEPVRHDPHSVPIEEQRGAEPQCLRRHRVAVALESHPTRRPYPDRIPKNILVGRDGQRPQSPPFLLDPRRRGHSGRPIGTDLVDLVMPPIELGDEVLAVVEPLDFEEPVLHETHEVLDRSLLPAGSRCTQLGDNR